MGFDFVGCEIDKDYFEAQEKRWESHISQIRIVM
jgi:DNA modification methylase